MSENTQMDSVSGKALTGPVISEMLMKNFERLPDFDQKLFIYGPMYVGLNGSFAGLISNSLYRRSLNLRQAAIASALPMAALPFLTTFALYNVAVSQPLMSGELNCPTCVLMRGALVGVLGGGLYPILLAFPVNIGLASRYNTTPLPERGSQLRFWVDLSRPVLRRMRAVLLLQAFFGTYLSSRNLESYVKLAELTFGRREELKD